MNIISVRKSNLNDICRVCLSATNAPYTDIFSASPNNLSSTIANAVMECAPVHIVEGDGLPSLICSSCNNNLEISHQFRTLCIRSESILERYVAHITTAQQQQEQQQQIENIEINTTVQNDDTIEIINDSGVKMEDGDNCDNGVKYVQDNGNQMDTTETQTIYIKEEDASCIQNGLQHSTIIKEITTAHILEKPPEFSAGTATVIKHEIITEAGGEPAIKLKLDTDGNCYQLHTGTIENACFTTDNNQTQEIQYRFFNPIISNTDGQIIKVTNAIDNSKNTVLGVDQQNQFESYLVKLFTKDDSTETTTIQTTTTTQPQPPAEQRPHKCNVCLKTFKRSSNLSEHAKVHSECRPYKCEVCQKWFKRSCDLAEHKRSHSNERPFKCTVCPKSFKRNCDLSEHMKIHTNERPFECDICHKGFKRNGQYLEHRRIHTGERPYECDVCHQHFRTSSKLSAHSRIHNEERNHKCTLCPKSFRSYKSLTIHSRVHLDQ